MAEKVNCYLDNNIITYKFQTGESLEVFASKYQIPSNKKLICCLSPCHNNYHSVITRIPLKHIPQNLYFYIISQSQYSRLFKRIIVNDESDQYPTIQFLIGIDDTLRELERMFIYTKGYAKGIDIAFMEDNQEEYPPDWKVDRFGREEVELMAKKKVVTVAFDYNRSLAGELEIKHSNFNITARALFLKHKKHLQYDITNDADKMHINYWYKGKNYNQNDIINPEYQSQVKIRIKDDSNKTMLYNNDKFQETVAVEKEQKSFYQAPDQKQNIFQKKVSAKDEKANNYREFQSQQKSSHNTIQNMLVFKQMKESLRNAFEIPDLSEQNQSIKDIISLGLRAIMN